jgi:hypothetical protein
LFLLPRRWLFLRLSRLLRLSSANISHRGHQDQ